MTVEMHFADALNGHWHQVEGEPVMRKDVNTVTQFNRVHYGTVCVA